MKNKLKPIFLLGSIFLSEAKSVDNIGQLVPEIQSRISQFLDLPAALKYLTTGKSIQQYSDAILAVQIPNMYVARNTVYPKEVFFQIADHPHWTPWVLPDDICVKLHKWYFQAMKINDKGAQPEQIKNKFKLLYSAASLGHKLAAEQAGALLMNSLHNSSIPTVITYDLLQLEVPKWDVCRFNQPLSINGELQKILNKYQSSNTDFENPKALFEAFLTDVKSLPFTKEVEIIVKLLTETLEHIKEGGELDGFIPKGTLKFLKENPITSPFLDQVLSNFGQDEDSFPDEVKAKKKFLEFLNILTVEAYSDSLNPKINDIKDVNGCKQYTQKKTPEATKLKPLQIDLNRGMVLLGEITSHFGTMMSGFEGDGILFEQWEKDYSEPEARIHTFLYHLMITRKPTSSDAWVYARDGLKNIFWVKINSQSVANINKSRYDALVKAGKPYFPPIEDGEELDH